MKKIKLIVCFVLISFFAAAQSAIGGRAKVVPNFSNLKSVKIGDQVWSAENLNTNRFANGDLIPEMKSNLEWGSAGKNQQPAWCYYNNDPENGQVYGKLYNWYAVADPRGLCPIGWHVPSDEEWTILENNLGKLNAGGQMKEIDLYHWGSPNEGATNQSGFAGLPGGYRALNGSNCNIGEYGLWWSVAKHSQVEAYNRSLCYANRFLRRFNLYMSSGLSVRCVKD